VDFIVLQAPQLLSNAVLVHTVQELRGHARNVLAREVLLFFAKIVEPAASVDKRNNNRISSRSFLIYTKISFYIFSSFLATKKTNMMCFCAFVFALFLLLQTFVIFRLLQR